MALFSSKSDMVLGVGSRYSAVLDGELISRHGPEALLCICL